MDFASIVTNRHPSWIRDSYDWAEWRDCYEGGRTFRDRYLEMLPEREKVSDFLRRKNFTPIPTFAKVEINRVKNALFQRFDDITRSGGTIALHEAADGAKRGVDNKGTSMNSFMGKVLLPDLLVMGQVGVLVDAPRVNGPLQSDIPTGFRPYLSAYSVENIHHLVENDPGKESDFKAVLLCDSVRTTNVHTGVYDTTDTFRYYWIDEASGFVHIAHLNVRGEQTEELIVTNLTEIPFVLYDIGDSLIKDVCRHQIAMLNIASSDTNYVIDSNFPWLSRQRSGIAADHLGGTDTKITPGVNKGVWYEKGLNPPAYIAPPTDPMKLSLEMRQRLKEEIREMVLGVVESIGFDGTIDAGLAYVGECLEQGENRVWDHWTAYEQTNPSRRRHPIVKYPDNWTIKSERERIEDARELLDLMFRVPGRGVKKEIAKLATQKLLRGRVAEKQIDEYLVEIDQAPYCTSDPTIVIPAKKEGIMSGETASLALGGVEGEWDKAEKDRAKRAADIAIAQSDAANGAGRGVPEMSVDPNNARAEQDDDRAGDLGGDTEEGQRGEGQPIPNLED